MHARPAAALAALLLAGSAALGSEKEVTGRVVDEAGEPVAGAAIGSYWAFEDHRWNPHRGFAAEDDGSFSGSVVYYNRAIALMAMDEARERGGLVVLDDETIDEPATITLRPLVRFHGTITSRDLGWPVEWTNVYMSVMPARARIASFDSREGAFSFLLPPGAYQFWAYGTDLRSLTKTITLSADRRDHDMGEVDVAPSIIAQHYGKAPPKWSVTDARGAEIGAQPADYKGKWVLLEFWGFW